jgi:hypothetical protein
MASTSTPILGLFKPVPGTAEPFRSEDINGNWDILDESFTVVELKPNVQAVVTSGITVNGGTA